MFFYAHPVTDIDPFHCKSTLWEFKHFACFARPGTTCLLEIKNLTVQYDADPIVWRTL